LRVAPDERTERKPVRNTVRQLLEFDSGELVAAS
jgi:hypothetical protein